MRKSYLTPIPKKRERGKFLVPNILTFMFLGIKRKTKDSELNGSKLSSNLIFS
jgi:hypothetical protein